jgi:hypothetical protein
VYCLPTTTGIDMAVAYEPLLEPSHAAASGPSLMPATTLVLDQPHRRRWLAPRTVQLVGTSNTAHYRSVNGRAGKSLTMPSSSARGSAPRMILSRNSWAWIAR